MERNILYTLQTYCSCQSKLHTQPAVNLAYSLLSLLENDSGRPGYTRAWEVLRLAEMAR
jgi:hypothetical protein